MKPRERAGQVSIASAAPAGHSAPIPMPNSARKKNRNAKVGEKPPMKLQSEYQRMEIISGALRPNRSAIQPAAVAPSSALVDSALANCDWRLCERQRQLRDLAAQGLSKEIAPRNVSATPGQQRTKCILHGSKVERRGTKYLGELGLGLRVVSAIVPSVLRYLGHWPGNSGGLVGLAPTSHLHARRPSDLSCSRRWSPAKLAPACPARGQISEL